jgi:hypothetical protein
MPTAADSPCPIAAATTREPPADKSPLPDVAVRALAEAATRRNKDAGAKGETGETGQSQAGKRAGKEVGGRGGLDPTRYGDWEINGLASDF